MTWRTVAAAEAPRVAPMARTAHRSERTPFTVMAAGIDDIVKDTNDFRDKYDYTNDFDLYDNMLNYDPELNGAVRTISLTANKYRVTGAETTQFVVLSRVSLKKSLTLTTCLSTPCETSWSMGTTSISTSATVGKVSPKSSHYLLLK